MYWTSLVLVRPAASLYSASPLKRHPKGKQWCPNPDHYSDSEPARRSLSFVLSAKQSSRTSNFNVFCLMWPGIEPPTSRVPGERSTTTLPGRGMVRWAFLYSSKGCLSDEYFSATCPFATFLPCCISVYLRLLHTIHALPETFTPAFGLTSSALPWSGDCSSNYRHRLHKYTTAFPQRWWPGPPSGILTSHSISLDYQHALPMWWHYDARPGCSVNH